MQRIVAELYAEILEGRGARCNSNRTYLLTGLRLPWSELVSKQKGVSWKAGSSHRAKTTCAIANSRVAETFCLRNPERLPFRSPRPQHPRMRLALRLAGSKLRRAPTMLGRSPGSRTRGVSARQGLRPRRGSAGTRKIVHIRIAIHHPNGVGKLGVSVPKLYRWIPDSSHLGVLDRPFPDGTPGLAVGLHT